MSWTEIAGIILIAFGAFVTFGAVFITRKVFHDEEAKTSPKAMMLRGAGFVVAAVGLIIMTQL